MKSKHEKLISNTTRRGKKERISSIKYKNT
jgi:hypothetical protein